MDIGWESVFKPDTPLLEIFLRGSITYLAIFTMLRIIRRSSGEIGIADILVIVLVADAAQNGMAHDYTSVTDGLCLVATILFWSYALNWLTYHSRTLERLISPPPTKLVENGRMLRKNMRTELLTEDELLAELRKQGVEDLSQVRRACMEADGRVTVIKMETA